jgi:hypothetical protein
MFAVIGTSLFSQVDKQRFGTLAHTAFTLFTLSTYDNWGYMFSDNRDKAPYLWIYLWAYILTGVFIFCKYVPCMCSVICQIDLELPSLFLAVIVSNLQAAKRLIRNRRRDRKMKRVSHHAYYHGEVSD